MPESMFSSSWYRVASLRPSVRHHAQIHRHVYRGQPWYVMQDHTNQKFHRFTPATQTVIGLMDGQRNVHEIWLQATEVLGDDAPSQDDMIRLLSQLHSADVLRCDVPPDTAEMLERFTQKERREFWARFMNPFAIRIPLFDPEKFLTWLLPFVAPLMGWLGVGLWLAVVAPAIYLLVIHWTEFTHGFVDRVITPQNLVLIWLIFPVIKAVHEVAHGIFAKAFGCEIHDMGIMFLVFTPIPYVDASSASALPEKSRRALVGAAGMIAEVFLAALATYVWVNVEPGVVHALAFNAVVIGGITTIGFNGNPLLRFDGYYILADLVEIPNLRSRSNQYLRYLLERYAFGRHKTEPPDLTPGEPAWLVGFAVASFLYRVIIIVAIFMFVLEFSLVLGTILIVLASLGWFVVPTFRTLSQLFSRQSGVEQNRARSIGVLVGAAASVVFLVAILPLPYRTLAEGIVWIPEEALVRAENNGFVTRVVATPGALARPGDLLFECEDRDLEAEVKVHEARLEVLDAQYRSSMVNDRVRAKMVDAERRHIRGRLADGRDRLANLAIYSHAEGIFVPAQPEDLPGRFVRQGQPIAHVLRPGIVSIRAVVNEDDVDLVRAPGTTAVVRLSEHFDDVHEAVIVRVAPSATDRLPSTALGTGGGGQIAIDPRDERGLLALEKQFVIELDLPDDVTFENLGGRVYVRFDHGYRSIGGQWFRELRQLFLSRLNV